MNNNILKINNDYSYFISSDFKIKTKLWTLLRFRERNYFHNRLYKAKIWDGYFDFFNKDSGKFLTGLLPEITYALNKLNIPYEIQDLRKNINFIYTEIDSQFLKPWNNSVTLHDYQVEYTNVFLKNQRGIVYSPTGSGKTLILINMLKSLPPGTPTLILQNKVSLARQNYDEIVKWGIENVGTLWGNKVKPNIITVATFQSIKKIEKLLPKIKAVFVDEIHENMSKIPKAVYRKLKNCNVRVCFSATPFKFGEKDQVQKYFVKGFFGPIFKTKDGIIKTQDLQNREILSKSKCIFYPIKEPQLPLAIYQDAVTYGIAKNFDFHNVVVRLTKIQKGRTLILVDRIQHGDFLKNMLPEALWIQGKDDEETRKYVIEQLKNSENVVAIATQQIFNTGLNFYLHNLINCADVQADHMILQRIGRGLRPAEDKESLNYYDFIFEINNYLLEHSKKRIKLLKAEGHEVIVKNQIDF